MTPSGQTRTDDAGQWEIERLGRRHDRSQFDCGNARSVCFARLMPRNLESIQISLASSL
jgi:hypothetical protein